MNIEYKCRQCGKVLVLNQYDRPPSGWIELMVHGYTPDGNAFCGRPCFRRWVLEEP